MNLRNLKITDLFGKEEILPEALIKDVANLLYRNVADIALLDKIKELYYLKDVEFTEYEKIALRQVVKNSNLLAIVKRELLARLE